MSPGGDPGSKFNDTMRLRLRAGRRDTRDTFTDNKLAERRLLSPGRPRPREPPPPPPPPALEVTSPAAETSTTLHPLEIHHRPKSPIKTFLDSPGFVESAPPPPPPPPRQIFPFTKEQLEQINLTRIKSGLRPRSSSNSPVRNPSESTLNDRLSSRRTSLTFPIVGILDQTEEEVPLWHRDSSLVSGHVNSLMPLDENVPATETLSSVTEFYQALEKNCKISEEESAMDESYGSKGGDVEKTVKLIVPSATDNVYMRDDSELSSQNRTIVTVSSPTQNMSVTSPKSNSNRKTSIMITGQENLYDRSVNKTSVVIGDYKPVIKDDWSNKVTINVGGFDYQNNSNKTAKTNNQIEIKNEFKSNIKIGPSDNKSTTLLILEPTLPGKDVVDNENLSQGQLENVTKEIPTIDIKAQKEMNELIKSKIDPVEAARKNIVPHVCGKITNEYNKFSINSDKSSKIIDTTHYNNDHTHNKIEERDIALNTQSSTESEGSLEDDVFATKDDTDENSDCYVCAKKLKAKNGKQEDEEEGRIALEFDSDENHYEIIRDPIYEEISDTPPPLPLSPPPATPDINDSVPTRSIFEGASKYDILNYLETAKERGIVVESEDDSELRSPEHSRISSLDLSSRISQLSNASDSSEDSCNLIISPPDTASISSDKVGSFLFAVSSVQSFD